MGLRFLLDGGDGGPLVQSGDRPDHLRRADDGPAEDGDGGGDLRLAGEGPLCDRDRLRGGVLLLFRLRLRLQGGGGCLRLRGVHGERLRRNGGDQGVPALIGGGVQADVHGQLLELVIVHLRQLSGVQVGLRFLLDGGGGGDLRGRGGRGGGFLRVLRGPCHCRILLKFCSGMPPS